MDAGCGRDNFVSLFIKKMIMTTKISYAIAILLDLGMVFLGARFFSLLK